MDQIIDVECLQEKITSKGHWKILIRPHRYVEELIPLEELPELLEKNQVALRGWNYPHTPHRNEDIRIKDHYIEYVTDWRSYLEILHFYQSGQFFHLKACPEDWLSDDQMDSRLIESRPFLSVVSTVYTITEVYEFARRLAQEALFGPTIRISVALHGTEGRRLIFYDAWRELFHDYVCAMPEIVHWKDVSIEELLANSPDLALDSVLYLLRRFGWLNVPRRILKEDQTKLLEHRLI